MSWVTAIWTILIGGCVALALPPLLVGIWLRRTDYLFFVLLTVSVIGIAISELLMAHSASGEQFGQILQWEQLPTFLSTVALIFFICRYFGTGRWWLGMTIITIRFVCLVLNFLFPPNLYFRQMTGLEHFTFLGDRVAVPIGTASPWIYLAELSSPLGLIFVLDASVKLWRKGGREAHRRAIVVGGSIIFFLLMGGGLSALTDRRIIQLPYMVSFSFAAILVAMAFELGLDLFQSRVVAEKLRVTEASLQESEIRFRTAADAAPVMMWMAGPDKLCTFFNKSWLEFTGRKMEQELGNGWTQGVHPDDLDECLKTYVAAFEARKPFVMQYRLRRYDGKYRWIKDDGVPRFDARKNFAGYVGSCVDITELITNEQALRESEERMRMALDATHVRFWEWNYAKDELWGTETGRNEVGLPVGKIRFEEAISRVHVADRDRLREVLMEAARDGKDFSCEYRIIFVDGTERWTDLRGRHARTAAGEAVLRGVSIDVTERKQAEEQFRLAVEASPSGIILVNQTGQIVLVNAHVEELFGYKRDELIGQLVEVLIPDRLKAEHPADRTAFLAAPQARAMGAGRELFARRKNGTEFPVEIGLSPIHTPKGTLVLTSVIDISARKLAEKEAHESQQQINLLSRVSLLGETTAFLAHELNQPLSAIVSNANAGMRFIGKGNTDPEQLREILADVAADGARAHQIVRNVRNTIKKGSAIRRPIRVNEVVEEVARMVRSDALAHSCNLKTSLAKDLPAVEGDPIQVQQVLINLVSNAFHAMREVPAGNREVEIVTEAGDNGAVCVSVRDHGLGIPDKVRHRLFEQFFTTREEGLGMGLTIVRSIIEAHAGKISAENVEGGGARFLFTLPAAADTSNGLPQTDGGS
jgi:PAS domain S-box-containing protein